MAKRYISYEECRDKSETIFKKLDIIEGKIGKLSNNMIKLEVKFNQELKNEIDKRQNVSKWKLAVSIAVISGLISFLVAIAVK